jgi:hypothetical protein
VGLFLVRRDRREEVRSHGTFNTFSDKLAPYKNRGDFLGQIPRTPEKSIEITKETCRYVWETFGTFPAVVPPMVLLYYIQARHSELEFFDKYYPAGAYLKTPKQHMDKWHKKAGAAPRAAGVAMSDQREA